MLKIQGLMNLAYMYDRLGYAQMWMLCANVMVPRDVPESDLQHAANELFRINNELRARFVEDGDTNEVYQEIMPFEERTFDVLHFESREEMDAWGQEYASIPLTLDVRTKDKKGIPTQHWLEAMGIKPTAKDIAKGAAQALSASVKRKKVLKKLGVKDIPACCEVKLVKLPDASGAIVKVHHIVSDAWSMSLMASQFLQVLKGETPIAYSYEEHLAGYEDYFKTKAYQRDLAFFENQLKACPADQLPTNLEGRRKTAVLDKDLTKSIWDYASAHNITPYALFFAAMGTYLRCKKNREKSFVGSVCLNRTGVHERNMVGLFVNTPPVLLELDPDATFADTVDAVGSANFTAMRHQKATNYASIPTPYLYIVSYQITTFDVDPTASCTQYYCNNISFTMLTAEDRSMEGRFKLHLDYSLETSPDGQEMDELLSYVVAVLREGIADDSKKISELGK